MGLPAARHAPPQGDDLMPTETGTVDAVAFTMGGAGNQWTTIDGIRYATWWDIRTRDWQVGDCVTFTPYRAPLWSGMVPILCADNIQKCL
jgi:hypothetical protein